MKKFCVAVAAFCFVFGLALSTARSAEITPTDIASKPNVFMKVSQEPNPLLLGHWGCTNVVTKSGDTFAEPIEYWLLKVDGKYALYFFRYKPSARKEYRGWREWYLKGDEISAPPEISIFVKGNEVYFQWKGDSPTKMMRID